MWIQQLCNWTKSGNVGDGINVRINSNCVKDKNNSSNNTNNALTYINLHILLFLNSFIIANTLCDNVFAFVITFLLSYVFIKIILNKYRFSISPKIKEMVICNKPINRKIILRSSFICFAIILIGECIYWKAFYPGGFNLDAVGQWMQSVNDLPFNNWHPVISTLWYKILICISSSFSFVIFSGLVLFAIAFSYVMSKFIKYNISEKVVYIISIVVALCPTIMLFNICMIKDVQFAILVTFLFGILIEIYMSRGIWLKNKLNFLCFAIILVITSMVRHNAILFTLFLVIGVHFCVEKNLRYLLKIIIILMLSIIIIINVFVYRLLNVEKHSNIVGEISGIAMCIMVNALVTDSENLPSDVHEFLNQFASDEQFKDIYICGEWDSCKWDIEKLDLLSNVSINTIILLTIKTICVCPQASYEAVKEATRMMWQVEGNVYWYPEIYIEDNSYNIVAQYNNNYHYMFDKIIKLSVLPIFNCVWSLGLIMLILLFIAHVANSGIKNITFLFPIIINTFFTTLMLCGPNYRYFYYINILFIPLIFVLLFFDNFLIT